jgi:hypothetical protein
MEISAGLALLDSRTEDEQTGAIPEARSRFIAVMCDPESGSSPRGTLGALS